MRKYILGAIFAVFIGSMVLVVGCSSLDTRTVESVRTLNLPSEEDFVQYITISPGFVITRNRVNSHLLTSWAIKSDGSSLRVYMRFQEK